MRYQLLEYTRARGTRASPAAVLLVFSMLALANNAFAGLWIQQDLVGPTIGGVYYTDSNQFVSDLSITTGGSDQDIQFEVFCVEPMEYVPLEGRGEIGHSLATSGNIPNRIIDDEPTGLISHYFNFSDSQTGHTDTPVRIDPVPSEMPAGTVVVPAPGSALISAMGLGLIGCVRRRITPRR